MKAAHPGAEVTLWAQDEHRLGLLPVSRRIWVPCGQRPVGPVRRQFQWLYVYGFVRPETGQTWWCLLPAVSAEAFGLALAEFVRDEGITARRRAVVVLDRAGWHVARGQVIPDGIDLVFLPPYSPELQPADRLWGLVDAPVANRVSPDLDVLEVVLVRRRQAPRRQRRRVKGHTRFHWWPREPRPQVAQ